MKNKGEKLSRSNFYWIYLAGFFLIVLQMINVFFFWTLPHDWGKAISFRVILSVMAFFFLWQVFSKEIKLSYIKLKIKSVYAPFCLLLALFIIYLLATIFSINQHFSLWGDPLRNGGFINFSFYIFLAILAFLIIKKNSWQKILDFLILISVVVSVIALIQQFGIFGKYFIPFVVRPVSTMGNPILLALYLVLVTFLALALGLNEKNRTKKIFYFFSLFLFLFVNIFLVQTRGAYLGLAIGFLWFLFAYPNLNLKVKTIKIYAAIFLIVLFSGMYFSKIYLDSHLYVYGKMPLLLSSTVDRTLGLFEGLQIAESRVSVWKVSLDALKEKPILGWGQENFVVAFDKYYDPSLPKIGNIAPGDTPTEWFDRAHSFMFDVPITGGIPALLIYLSLFGTLIWQLQRVKYYPNTRIKSESTNISNLLSSDVIMAHGLQATFLGYLTTLASGFDSVSTYLVVFFLIGYSLYLISNSNLKNRADLEDEKLERISHKLYRLRHPLIIITFLIVGYFIWVYNIIPLSINREMNLALLYADIRTEESCEKGLNIIDNISPSVPNSIINNYLGQKSTFVIFRCNDKIKSKQPEDLIKQNIKILKKNIEKNPQYVTNWILIGEYTGILIKEKNSQTENVFILNEETERLKNEVDYYFENALLLSPKRQLILKDWADVQTISAQYKKAEENLQKCMDLNPSYARCYWYMALNKGYQKDYEGFKSFSEIAKEKNYGVELPESLREVINMYIRNDDYNGLAEVYPTLIPLTLDPLEKAQLHASLAATYKELGDIKKAREEVLKIKEVIPFLPKELQETARNDVEEFLKILSE